jgi:hypothetical protein
MLDNEPLIKYGHLIILICTISYWALSKYLEVFLGVEENE